MASKEQSVEQLNALLVDQSALRRVATLVATDPDPRVLFDCVCEELGRVLGVDSTDMIRFESGDTATVVGTWAADERAVVPGRLHHPGRGRQRHGQDRPERAAAARGRLPGRGRRAGGAAAGIRDQVDRGAPIKVSGRLWGAIMAVGAEPGEFPEGTEQRIAEFAELVTAALANADAREQLAASRARIVEAGYAERRRLERDLHDGAQQEFVGAALSLKLARDEWSDAPDEALERLDAALERVQAGLRDLRELAAGIHPSVLSDRGLGAALESLASRSAVPVELAPLPPGRLPASVETTAYFVVAEALTNAAKHAQCERAEVAVRLENGSAVITVADDGVGGADPTSGSGLRGLADRVSALGGRLDDRQPAGRGHRDHGADRRAVRLDRGRAHRLGVRDRGCSGPRAGACARGRCRAGPARGAGPSPRDASRACRRLLAEHRLQLAAVAAAGVARRAVDPAAVPDEPALGLGVHVLAVAQVEQLALEAGLRLRSRARGRRSHTGRRRRRASRQGTPAV